MTKVNKKKCCSCGVDSGGKYYCDTCRKAHRERNQQRRKARKEAGLCTECKRPAVVNKRMCKVCQDKYRIKQRQRKTTRLKAGKCAMGLCDNMHLHKQNLCESCAKAKLNNQRERSIMLTDNGLCSSCGQKPFLSSMADVDIITKLCEVCYVKQVSAVRLGTTKHWKLLLEIFEQQDRKCPYTGQIIKLGFNSALDHRFPRSRFPDKKLDPTNMQWTTRLVNSMKLDSTHEEFVQLVCHIFSHLQGKETGDLNKIRPPARF